MMKSCCNDELSGGEHPATTTFRRIHPRSSKRFFHQQHNPPRLIRCAALHCIPMAQDGGAGPHQFWAVAVLEDGRAGVYELGVELGYLAV